MDIKLSVGKGGKNTPTDTRVVQTLLNQQRSHNSQFATAVSKPLDVDGRCGAKTIEAITSFQSVVLKWRPQSCDGLVSPGRKTISALNGSNGSLNCVMALPVNASGYSGFNLESFLSSYAPPVPQLGPVGAAGATPAAQSTSNAAESFTSFKQGNYKGETLGSGSLSMSGYGCALCTLTMAATHIGSRTSHWPDGLMPKDLTPVKANSILIKGGGFSGSLIIMKTGATALGMDYVEYGRGSNLGDADYSRIAAHVQAGKPVAAHVDYKKSANGDHWILITKKNGDGSFTAIDPATGKTCTLRRPKDDPENLRLKDRGENGKVAVLAGWPDGGGSSNQQKYNVVRYGLLSRKVAPL